jgi:hypothetical protein
VIDFFSLENARVYYLSVRHRRSLASLVWTVARRDPGPRSPAFAGILAVAAFRDRAPGAEKNIYSPSGISGP